MSNNQSKHLIGCIVCGVLTAIGIVAAIISLFNGVEKPWFYCVHVQLLLLILISYYAFVGYKKPHGNLLKYVMLVFALFNLTYIPCYVSMLDTQATVICAIEIGLICYVSGRLAKVKQNMILMILITVCELVFNGLDIIYGYINIDTIGPLAIWLDICVAYFLRYKEHKEAGLQDAPTK